MRYLLLFSLLYYLSISLTLAQDQTITYKNVANDIVDNYNSRHFENIRQYFSEKSKSDFSEKRTRKVFGGLYNQYGKIVNTGIPRVEDNTKFILPVLFENDSTRLEMYLPFNEENKLTGIRFLPAGSIRYPRITDSTSIDDIVRPYMNKKENAGISIGVFSNEHERYYNYGVTKKGSDNRPDSLSIYEIGSVTKVFTSILLADLVRKKLVNYNDGLSKYLPDSIAPLKYKNREITLIDLATHRSGLPPIPDNLETTMKDSLNPYTNYSLQNLYSFLKNYKLDKMPGKEYGYSNLGMGLLGVILASQLKMTYEDAIKKEILDKSSMHNTVINLTDEQERRFVRGYNEDGNPTPPWDIPTLAGAGAFHSDTKDLITFIRLNLGQGERELVDIINETQVKRTHETGLGWHFLSIGKDNIIWHNGGTYGFSSFIGFNRNKNIGVVVLSNSANSVDEIGKLILERELKVVSH